MPSLPAIDNIGALADAEAASGDGTLIALLKRLRSLFGLRAGIGSWTVVGNSAANTAQTLTKAAGGAGVKHYASSVDFVLNGAAAGAADVLLELKDGATVKWRGYFGASAARGTRIAANFNPPIEGTANTAMTLESAAAGTGAIVTATLVGTTL